MNRLAIRALALAALFVLAATTAGANSNERKGTSGASEMLIPVGPRGSALGSAVASDVTGAEATFWNPAGLASVQGTEALFSHTEYFADMKVNYAAVAVKAGGLGVLGFNAKVLSVGDVVVTTEQAPDGTGEILQPTFSVLGASWAKAFTDRVRFGATVDFDLEHVGSMSASGVAADFGVQYDTGWRGLQLAMTMKNFGTSMHFSGDNLDVSVLPPGAEPGAANRVVQFTTAAFEMPSYFTLSGAWNLYRQPTTGLKLLGAFQNNNFVGDNFSGGAEWTYRDVLALRGSWFGTLTTTSDPVNGDQSVRFVSGDDLYQGVAVGAGVNVKTGGSKLGVDMSWRPVRQFFSDIVEVGVHLDF